MEDGKVIHTGSFDELKHLSYFDRLNDDFNQPNLKEERKLTPRSPRTKIYQIKNRSPNPNFATERSKISVDENKEEIGIDWKVYYKFFTYTIWTMITLLILLLSLYLKKQTYMLFDYYLISWVKNVSESFENSPDVLTKAIVFKVISTLTNII